MKKMCFFVIAAGALVLAACQSAPRQAPAAQNVQPANEGAASTGKKSAGDNWERIDDKGAAFDVVQPDWVTPALQDDFPALTQDPRFKGKTPFVFRNDYHDLDMLTSWVNNFQAQGAIARQISNQVNAKFEGGLSGDMSKDPNNAAKTQKLKEIVATLSRTQVSGYGKEMDWWVLRRRKDTGAEQYTYLVVYSIDKNDLRLQIDKALGNVAARNAAEKELVDDMRQALDELEFGGIIPSN